MILTWFKKQKTITKLFIIIATIAMVYAVRVGVGKAYYKYQYFKTVEKKYTAAKDSIQSLNLEIKDLTQKQQIRTKNVQKKSKAINDKLKQDEEIIDNRNYSDAELNDFLSKYQDKSS
tara:strand:- start:156 stop:509 length:354 start_codon:yes stop_codon:yes gene_type:complete